MTDTDREGGREENKKNCSRCGILKDLDCFHFAKNKKSGKASHCKQCDAERKREFKLKNEDLIKAQGREQYRRNAPARRAAHEKWKKKNPEAMRAAKARHAATPKGKVERNVRGYIHKTIRKGYKNEPTFKALGYTPNELIAHLQSRFTDGMSWSNYGDWHIDHIIPLSAFSYKSTSDIGFKIAWSLNNLQPLWAEENIRKHAKVPKNFQPFLPL